MRPVTCSVCGITFGLPGDYVQSRMNDHGTFVCPSGHAQHFPQETQADTLRKELAAATKRIHDLESTLRQEKERADRNFDLAHKLGRV